MTTEGVDMAGKRSTPEQIVAKLRQVEVLTARGKPVAEAVRAIGVTEPTYCRWRSEYGGLKLDQVKRLKDLEVREFGSRPDQAAVCVGVSVASTPLRNLTPRTTFDNWLSPLKRRHVLAAAMTSLKTIRRAVSCDNAPLLRTALCRTVAARLAHGPHADPSCSALPRQVCRRVVSDPPPP
jgi:putative transposase